VVTGFLRTTYDDPPHQCSQATWRPGPLTARRSRCAENRDAQSSDRLFRGLDFWSIPPMTFFEAQGLSPFVRQSSSFGPSSKRWIPAGCAPSSKSDLQRCLPTSPFTTSGAARLVALLPPSRVQYLRGEDLESGYPLLSPGSIAPRRHPAAIKAPETEAGSKPLVTFRRELGPVMPES